MKHDPCVSLKDIQMAGGRVQEIIKGLDKEDFLEDWQKQWAVNHGLLIVVEAHKRLRAHPELAALLPDLQKDVDFRNVLAHDYDTEDLETEAWEYATTRLPILLERAQEILAELEPDPAPPKPEKARQRPRLRHVGSR